MFGAWVRDSLPELRTAIPDRYPIRHYPDITHSLRCQYPVPGWDPAFALTLGRECINPRPYAMKSIHNRFAPYCIGSVCYSEGINDDVNKFVWLDQEWDPERPVMKTLRDYSRFFVDESQEEEIAHAAVGLERNFEGPLIANEGVERTLFRWLDLERNVSERARG